MVSATFVGLKYRHEKPSVAWEVKALSERRISPMMLSEYTLTNVGRIAAFDVSIKQGGTSLCNTEKEETQPGEALIFSAQSNNFLTGSDGRIDITWNESGWLGRRTPKSCFRILDQ